MAVCHAAAVVHAGNDIGYQKTAQKLHISGHATWSKDLGNYRPDFIANRWATLKVVAARDSPEYEARPVIADDSDIAGSRLRKYWLDGPNGRDLCLVLPVPGLSRLSKLIFPRLKPEFSRRVSLQAAQAIAQLHSGPCHGGRNETIQAHGSQRSQPEWHEEAAQGHRMPMAVRVRPYVLDMFYEQDYPECNSERHPQKDKASGIYRFIPGQPFSYNRQRIQGIGPLHRGCEIELDSILLPAQLGLPRLHGMGKGLADSQKSNPGPRRVAPVFSDATRTLVLIDEGPGDSPNQEKVHSTEMSSMPMCFVPLTQRITEKRMRVNETSLAEVFQFPGSPEKRSRRSLRREPMMP
ncbi:hypothetical protein MCOR11_009210 [Pyricularia oryzae]|nr:hypothetical protein MCOR11_009210 [Pyricularia oryzae]